MNKGNAFKVTADDPSSLPYIEKVPYEDPEGVSWREAKKQLRKFYLFKAAELRSISVTDAFPDTGSNVIQVVKSLN